MENGMRRICVLVCFFFAFLMSIENGFSQAHTGVDLDDAVYALLEIGELRGAIGRLSSVKPYSRSTVVEYLKTMQQKRTLFSAYEQRVIDKAVQRVSLEKTGLKYGAISSADQNKHVSVGVDLLLSARLNTEQVSDWHLRLEQYRHT
jgi:hypothetical protein